MAQTSGFFNAQLDGGGNFDRVYIAEQFAEYFSNFIGNGVFEGQLNQLQVIVGGGLNVNVLSGKAFCKGFWYKNSDAVTLPIDTPAGLLNRIDNIVVRFDFTQRVASLDVVKGTPASVPVAPSLVRTGTVYELKLAQVYVRASASSITQSNITDTRSNNAVCGWVTGLIDQIDVTTLFDQWEAAYQESVDEMNAWEVGQKAAFDTWMSTLTQELNVDGYIATYEKIFTGFSQETSGDPYNNLYIAQSSLPNYFDATKRCDFVEVFVNGLRVPVFESTPSSSQLPSSIDNYYCVASLGLNGINMFFYKKISGTVASWELISGQEIIVRVGQFRKGVRS